MKLCVIGAGAAGLVALRHAARGSSPDAFDCTAFEQTDRIGGTWVYTESTGTDNHGLPIHSSMYKSLTTNIPKEAMGFPDFPIVTGSDESFLVWNDVLSYLEDYATHFDLLKFIKFNHHVKQIKNAGSKWHVTVTNLADKRDTTYEFDAVTVCNGHYYKPFVPQFIGATSFPGVTLHSHQYRTSDLFTGLRVVVVGEGPSGFDLTTEIAQVASKVYLSREPNKAVSDVNPYPSNVELKLKIAGIDGRKIIFDDASSAEVDSIFYCTGYEYDYPFLADDCGIRVVNNRVDGLYKHLICIAHPTLCIVGIPYMVCPFPMFDVQVRCFLNTLSGKVKLPSQKDMLKDTLEELAKLRQAGFKDKYFHRFALNPGVYYDDIAKIGNTEPLPPVINKIHSSARKNFRENRKTYKNYNYKIVDSHNFIETKKDVSVGLSVPSHGREG